MAQIDVFNPNSGTYFGNEYYPDNTGAATINASTFYVACGVKPLVSKNVTSLQVLNWSLSGTAQSTTVELRSDNGSGQPSSTVLTSGTYTPSASFKWGSASVTSYAVTAGTQYWIVIYGAGYSATNKLDIRRIDDPGAILTANGYQQYTSSNSGSTWSNAGSTFAGCAGFGYSDSTYEGIGYGDFDTNNIGNTVGSSTWGEYFNPATTFTASAVGMTIFKNAAGTPTADCTVVIQNADTSTIIESGTIVTAASVTQTAAWYTYTFSSNHTFTAGTNYRVYLQSAATASPQFTIRTPKTTNSGNGNAMSFGGATDVRTNGTTQSADHEATFRLTLVTGSTVTNTQSATARIALNFTKTNSATSRIDVNIVKTNTAIARVQQSLANAQSALSRIQQNLAKTQSATARLQKTITKTQPATGRIQQLLAVTHASVARISNTFTKTQSGVARIQSTVTKTQLSTARLQRVLNYTQAAKAAIASVVNKTQPSAARISQTISKPTTGISRISNTFAKTQSSVARVSVISSKTQTATARITGGALSKTQSSVARIAVNLTKAQGGVARIAVSISKTITAVSRISASFTKTQNSTARIASTYTHQQTATAHIVSAQVPVSNIPVIAPSPISLAASDKTDTITVESPAAVNIVVEQQVTPPLLIVTPPATAIVVEAPPNLNL